MAKIYPCFERFIEKEDTTMGFGKKLGMYIYFMIFFKRCVVMDCRELANGCKGNFGF